MPYPSVAASNFIAVIGGLAVSSLEKSSKETIHGM